MDIHDTDGVSSTIVKPKTGVFYIPYHCLVTNEISNLLLAGGVFPLIMRPMPASVS